MGIGSLGRKLFGGPAKASSSEGNHAYDELNSSLSPALGYVTGGGNMMGALLGIPGYGNQTDALNNFANSGGMQFLMDQGQKAVTSSKAAQGLLQSGSYGTALEKYGQGLASTYLNQYMQNLKDFSGIGLGAANVIDDAGKFRESNEEGKKQGIVQSLVSSFAGAPGGGAGSGGGG